MFKLDWFYWQLGPIPAGGNNWVTPNGIVLPPGWGKITLPPWAPRQVPIVMTRIIIPRSLTLYENVNLSLDPGGVGFKSSTDPLEHEAGADWRHSGSVADLWSTDSKTETWWTLPYPMVLDQDNLDLLWLLVGLSTPMQWMSVTIHWIV